MSRKGIQSSIAGLVLLGTMTVSGLAPLASATAGEIQHQWSGFYAGLNAGYGWSNASTDLSANPLGSIGLFGPAVAGGSIPQSSTNDANRFNAGIKGGYNWQNGPIVYGAEADVAYVNLKGSSSYSAAAIGGTPALDTTQDQSVDWLATLRARVGYLPTPTLLTYVTGGLAVGHVKASSNIVRTTGCTGSIYCEAGSLSQARWGWTLGGGLEYALARNWSINFEYLYFDLGATSYGLQPTWPTFVKFDQLDARAKFSGQIARVGVNWQF